ncbi:hypothetical protein MPSEU_000956400 [Mayamaea pseudoterrestris]|nr:hypothetical protein MPSEU_000956400 [Mayamaea pseudoterrestris]
MSDSMEVELLRQMMAERETRIELLKVKLSYYETKQTQLHSELEKVKDDRENEAMEQQGERIEWQHTHAETIKQLEQLTRDLHQQMASLKKYVAMVQKQQDKQQPTDSSFVMQMQAQLCKAMHSQGIVDHQLQLANLHADGLVKQLRDALVYVEEERTKVELEFMNSLVKEDTETREIENGFKEQLAEIQKEIAQLEDDMDEKSKGSDDEEEESNDENEQDSNDEEEDEEMKEAKQELMTMLHEQKEKIASLEKQNDKQLRQISSLKRRIDNPDASNEFESTPSEELGMSYDDDDDSESEGDETEHVDDEQYSSHNVASNGLIKKDATESAELPFEQASKEEASVPESETEDEDDREEDDDEEVDNSDGT